MPIVFAGIADPVAAGYVESLARPGRNATGFTVFEYSIAGKWLELLKEIAPRLTRVAVLREPGIAAGPGQFGVIQALAPSLGVELRPIDVREASEIERALTVFAQGSNGGVIVAGSPRATAHRNLIIALAAWRSNSMNYCTVPQDRKIKRRPVERDELRRQFGNAGNE